MTLVFLDEMTILDMDDKKISKEDVNDSNFFYGNSEEERVQIHSYQAIEYDRIVEFQRSYKTYGLKAYDNSKLIAPYFG